MEIHERPNSKVYLLDCMEGMKDTHDNYYDLAVVDPPYGINATTEVGFGDKKSGRANRPQKWGNKKWDEERPSKKFFSELYRISKNQIICGGNYFMDYLHPSRCWLVWDKVQRVNQADAELIYTSFNTSVRVFQYHCSKLQGFQNPNRFHPTEKPVALYDWIYKNYLPEGGKVLDTHLGSVSNRISANKAGNIDFTGYELDPDYFRDSNKRYEQFIAQTRLF